MSVGIFFFCAIAIRHDASTNSCSGVTRYLLRSPGAFFLYSASSASAFFRLSCPSCRLPLWIAIIALLHRDITPLVLPKRNSRASCTSSRCLEIRSSAGMAFCSVIAPAPVLCVRRAMSGCTGVFSGASRFCSMACVRQSLINCLCWSGIYRIFWPGKASATECSVSCSLLANLR